MPQCSAKSLTEDRSPKEVYPPECTDFHGVLSPIRAGKPDSRDGSSQKVSNSPGKKSSPTKSTSTGASSTNSSTKEFSPRGSSSKGPRPLLDDNITEPFPEGMFRIPVPDEVFSDLDEMKTSALRVLLVLIRKSFRFEDRCWVSSGKSFTTQDLETSCSLSRGGIRLGLSHLEDLGYVTADRSGHAHHFCLDLEVPQSRFTYLPVLLFRHTRDLTGPQLRLLLVVLRATWGWTRPPGEKGDTSSDASAPVHRRWACLSTSTLSDLTGQSETSVREAAQALQGSYLQRCRPTKEAYYYRFRPSSIRDAPDATTSNGGCPKGPSERTSRESERGGRPQKPKGSGNKQKGPVGLEECSRRVVQGFFSMPLPNDLTPFSKRSDPPNEYNIESSFVRKAKHRARAEKLRPNPGKDVVSGSNPPAGDFSAKRVGTGSEATTSRTSAQSSNDPPTKGNGSINEERPAKGKKPSEPSSTRDSSLKSEPVEDETSKAKDLLKKFSDGELSPENLNQQARLLTSSPSRGDRCSSDSRLGVSEGNGPKEQEGRQWRTSRPETPPSGGLASNQSPSSDARDEPASKPTSLNSTERDLAEKLVNAGVWRRRAVALARRFSSDRIEANFEYFREYPSPVESPGAFLNRAITQGYVLPSSSATGTPDNGRRALAKEAQLGSCPAPGSKVKESRREALIESGKATKDDFTRCLSPNDHCRMYFYRLSED